MLLLLISSGPLACGRGTPSRDADDPAARGEARRAPIFLDVTHAAGLDFQHVNGASGKFYPPEMMGAGAALFDFDDDGDLDVFLAQGRALDRSGVADPRAPAPSGGGRLWRNDQGVPGGSPRFVDVTRASGIAANGYGMGCAVGDVDGDGWPDLYLLNLGPNQLWRNRGDGTFEDTTAASGTAGAQWSTAASFLDFDRDGDLDLFVANYFEFSFADHQPCDSALGREDYCSPALYRPQADQLFRNRGDGTFDDVSLAAGVRFGYGNALGAVSADFDGDGWIDIYVANDLMPNLLWHNQGNGTFIDKALAGGSALDGGGTAEASMGLAVADFDRDDDEDVFITNLRGQGHAFYVNQGGLVFTESSDELGLTTASLWATGFGTAALDLDNDGWLDLFVANGDVQVQEALAARGDPFPLHQPNQVFRNVGGSRFEEVSSWGGDALAPSEVSRGLAAGDLDNDGDLDVLLTNNAGPARLLLNAGSAENHWLGLRLLAKEPRSDVQGAWVGVERAGAPTLWRRAARDGSYASAKDPRVLVGLGRNPVVDRVRVRWPDGREEVWRAPGVDAYSTLVRGTGREDEGATSKAAPSSAPAGQLNPPGSAP